MTCKWFTIINSEGIASIGENVRFINDLINYTDKLKNRQSMTACSLLQRLLLRKLYLMFVISYLSFGFIKCPTLWGGFGFYVLVTVK